MLKDISDEDFKRVIDQLEFENSGVTIHNLKCYLIALENKSVKKIK